MTTGTDLVNRIDHQQRLIEILAKLVARAWAISTLDQDEETERDFESWRGMVEKVWQSGVTIGFGPSIGADAERWEKEFEQKVLDELGLT